jgi:hypothetical protein
MSSKEIVEEKGKPQRRKTIVPLGVPVDKLAVQNEQAGMHYVWVYEPDLVTYLDAGYEHVKDGDPERVAGTDMTGTSGGVGSTISKIVNRYNGARQFLMRIPTDEWERQQELRNREAKAPLEAIRDGEAYQFKGSYQPKR